MPSTPGTRTEPPARSCVAVAALPKGARVEIEATAVL
ncbi:MAG: Rid family hydrolase [Bilophila sp.]